jgi:hypothetical protein
MFNDFLDYRDMLRYHGAGRALKGHFAAASLVFRGLWGGRGHESMNLGQPSMHGIVPDMTMT